MQSAPKFLVVGAGFYGAVMAYKIATSLEEPVLVIDRRDHIGGNCFTRKDRETGIETHCYGTHIFHTASQQVWDFISGFTKFNNYRHRVFTKTNGKAYTLPINLQTINSFFELDLTPSEARGYIAELVKQESCPQPTNLEEMAISQIGRELYNAFIKGYTHKQWQTDPRKLPSEIIARLPVRFNRNDFYFSDPYEGLPLEGYTKIFEKMLNHPNISVKLNCDFFDIRAGLPDDTQVIYTGPIDRFYDYKFGMLSWRTLDFEVERLAVDDYQGASVVNFSDSAVDYTRIHEFKHLHPERQYLDGKTIIMKEYSRFASANDEPYYPVNTNEDKEKYVNYRRLAEKENNVIFGGRLGLYRYFDMHHTIGAALETFENEIKAKL